jgi:hypothetical protein
MEKTELAATADDLLNIRDVIVLVPAPEIGPGKVVRVKCPNVEQLEELDAADWKLNPKTGMREAQPGSYVRWAAACVVDANNERIITPDRAKNLGKSSAKLLSRIWFAARNGVSADDPSIGDVVNTENV